MSMVRPRQPGERARPGMGKSAANNNRIRSELAGRHGRLTKAAAQALDKSGNGAGSIRSFRLLNRRDQSAADHRGIGKAADFLEVLGVGDAETDGNGKLCIAA